MSAIQNPRPTSRLTRDERMAALREAGAGYDAPLYKLGDDVVFDGRPSKVIGVSTKSAGIITVSNYAGAWMIGTSHSKLSPA